MTYLMKIPKWASEHARGILEAYNKAIEESIISELSGNNKMIICFDEYFFSKDSVPHIVFQHYDTESETFTPNGWMVKRCDGQLLTMDPLTIQEVCNQFGVLLPQ